MVVRQDEIKYEGKVVFERLEIAKNFQRAPKVFFEDEACFLFLSKGAFNFRTPDQVLSFDEGDGMLAKCGNYFIETDIQKGKTTTETVTVVGAFFYPEIVKKFFENDLSLEAFNKPITVSKVHIDTLLRHFIENLNYILDNPSVVDNNIIINKQKELLILLSKSHRSDSITDFINSLFSPYDYDFRKIIKENIYSDLNIKEFAYLCNMSEATFKRKFISIYNQSPAKYIQLKKLSLAKQLLKEQSNTISSIAYDCGFSTPSSFNKAFKKNFGLTPTEYRLS